MSINVRILLAEDEKLIREAFRNLMGELTSRIVETDTLSDTLRICELEDFDLVILDLNLLDARKSQSLAAIPEIKRKSRAPVLVLTGIVEHDIEKQALDAGADFVVGKGDMFSKTRALLLAIHAAVLKRPRAHPGDDYLSHVKMLERLVHAA